jgi:hypothetical protein
VTVPNADPSIVGSNIINQMASDMMVVNGTGAKGCRVGFFSFLEMMIYRLSCDHDVSRYLDHVNGVYMAVQRAREDEGL